MPPLAWTMNTAGGTGKNFPSQVWTDGTRKLNHLLKHVFASTADDHNNLLELTSA